MRTLGILFVLFSPLFGAADATRQLPTFGSPEKGSIRITAAGTGIECEGYYYITSKSLLQFIKEDKIKMSRFVVQLTVQRATDTETRRYTLKLKSLTNAHDFVLQEADIVWFTTPIIRRANQPSEPTRGTGPRFRPARERSPLPCQSKKTARAEPRAAHL
jgi:hypothetical protein